MSTATSRHLAILLVFALVLTVALFAGATLGYSQESESSEDEPALTMDPLSADDFLDGKIADETCMACHTVEAESMGVLQDEGEDAEDGAEAAEPADADSQDPAKDDADEEVLLAAKHATFGCLTCHKSEDVAKAHDGVTAPPTKKEQRAIRREARVSMGTKEFCLTCHESMEVLAERAADVTVVQDSKGKIVNPHAIPVNDAHAEAKVDECFNCHWIHGQSPAPNTNCASCHHSGVYECGTCHELKD